MTGLIIGIIVAVVVVVAVLGGLFFSGRDNGQKKIEGHSAAGLLDSAQSRKLKEANQAIVEAKTLSGRIKDADLQKQAREVADKAARIVETMRKQPDEIRCSSQFFNYYVPTLGVVLRKYLQLQDSGTDASDALAKTREYLADMASAFDRQYDNMFKDEELDLTVEVEAMQMALKRDGLI